MCGINGIFHFDRNKAVNKISLLTMRDILHHRGPDSKGYSIDENIGLGFRRLSIQDLTDAGNQPMISADGKYTIVFNGEIYNYRDFYPELKSRGIQFFSTSDTEVLLNLFILHGPSILSKLNGMFAFAIWNSEKRELFVARDRMGVKPFYYTIQDETFYFASEPKSIFAAGVEPEVSQEQIFEYLSCRFVAGENTLFTSVKRLLPGHSMVIKENGSIEINRWWKLNETILQLNDSKDYIEWFSNAFDNSIKSRMISDVPVGVLLSGGLDSGSIASSLNFQGYKDIETFTIGFSKKEHDETSMAKMLTEKFNFKFNPLNLEEKNLHSFFIKATWFCDEPLVHLNEPHILAMSELAKTKVSVLLSGEGADETLGGYVRYKPLKYHSYLNNIGFLVNLGILRGDRWKKLERYSSIKDAGNLILYNSSNFYPAEIKSIYGIGETSEIAYRNKILKEAQQTFPDDLQRQALYFDQHTYLCSLVDRNDRTTMGASIECREPFLDPVLLAGARKLPSKFLFSGKKGKFILRESMKNRLPQETLDFKKIGFSVPWNQYLRTNEFFKQELFEMQHSEMFTWKFLEHINPSQLIYNFQRGNNSLVSFILPLMSIHFWYKYYFPLLKSEIECIRSMHERNAN